MPVGIQRLNARHSQPNPHIVFIKPLKGPDENVARQFLERIAAQCVPIMRSNHISVMTLEEYEPNAEFVGRNFNAGEVIQLVLKTRGPRRERQWLPFSYVQMVMMHELAHCKQMNHSRAFWAVRNTYAEEMRKLWSAKYTGEGIWGRGAVLGTAGGTPLYERNVVADNDEALLMEHLCGGTYRSRGRKRKGGKGKEQLTYREREERRIKRKFGVNGLALGDDLKQRAKLEAPKTLSSGSSLLQTTLAPVKSETNPDIAAAPKMTKAEQKRLATKPRVAVSKRGRDLRAAAALARFDQAKKEETEERKPFIKGEGGEEDDLLAIKREEDFDMSEDDYDDDDASGPVGPDAVDIDGSRMVDEQGRGMVRVCEGMDEDGGDDGNANGNADDARQELRELMQGSGWATQDESDRARNPELYAIPPWVGPTEPLSSTATSTSTPASVSTRVTAEPQQKVPQIDPALGRGGSGSSQPTSSNHSGVKGESRLHDTPRAITSSTPGTSSLPTTQALPIPVKTERSSERSSERVKTEQAGAAQAKVEPVEPVEPVQPAPAWPVITITKLASGAKEDKTKGERRESSLQDIPAFNGSASVANTPASTECGVCSYANDVQAITCMICSHVLHPDVVPDAWYCGSASCQPAEGAVRYLNSADCGVCGVCGQRRP